MSKPQPDHFPPGTTVRITANKGTHRRYHNAEGIVVHGDCTNEFWRHVKITAWSKEEEGIIERVGVGKSFDIGIMPPFRVADLTIIEQPQ